MREGGPRRRMDRMTRLLPVLLALLLPSCQGLSTPSKKLESASQLWTGFRQVLSPSFEDTPQNVSTLVGDSAFLPCTVSHLGDRSVTWMRKRDLHILTADILTYSADERFRVLHPENSDDWTLHIQFATPRDAGVYECQVNSDPKISKQVVLNVLDSQLDDPSLYTGVAITDPRFPDYNFGVDKRRKQAPKDQRKGGRGRRRKGPTVSIEGPRERHIQRGSVLAVTCVVRHPLRRGPPHILWFHGLTNIDYDSSRGGVSIQTEKSNRRTVSKLMLSAVEAGDTGEYTCSPSDLAPAVVTVHVQDGQIQQPVKQGPGLASAAPTSPALPLLPALLTALAVLLGGRRP